MGAITEKLGSFIPKFYITFSSTWGGASDFLNMLPKCKISPRVQIHNLLWAQKLKTSEIIQSLQSHFPQYGDVQEICSRFH